MSNMMKIDELIHLQNPWFRDGGFLPKELKLPKREIFHSLYKEITEFDQVISLTGLRRVGKSTILRQIVGTLLQKNQRKVLYFSFDEPLIQEQTAVLEEVINYFIKNILQKDVYKIKEKTYLLFDEIQIIPYWQDIIKRYYDINQNLKFIVSGSSSLFIRKDSKESLAGRIFERHLPPLNFQEYCLLSGRKDTIEFLKFGQFPEILQFPGLDKKIEYLKEGIVRKVVEVDIPKIMKLKKQYNFERLFWSLLPNTGQIIETGKLMHDLSIKKASLFNYLNLLENALLYNKVINYSGSFRSEKRLLRKYYPISSNFLMLIPDTVNIGFFVESYVAGILNSKSKGLYLYRDRNREIDFILPERKLAVEVKYQETIHPSDYEILQKFCRERKYQGLLVTKKPQNIKDENISNATLETIHEII